MGLHNTYYGKDAEPANNNQHGPWVSPAHAEMNGGLANMRKILGMPEPEEQMIVESYETVASTPRVRPMRSNYNSEAGKGDE